MALRVMPGARPAAVLALVLGTADPAGAVLLQLSAGEVEQALELGRRAVAQEEFGEEWRVALADGGEIVVTTPFSRLAHAARQAAFKGEPLTDKQRQEALDRGKGKIQLVVATFGHTPDFARWYQPVLRVDGREIKASFTQNERTGRRLDDGRYLAHNVYVFPLEGLPARGSATLVVRHAVEQKEVFRAALPLGKMR